MSEKSSLHIKKHIVIMRPGFEQVLREEYAYRFQLSGEVVGRSAVAFAEQVKLPKIVDSVFARQILPRAFKIESTDMQALVGAITRRIDVMSQRNNRQMNVWTLHAFAIDDDPRLQKAMKIAKAVMAHVRAHQKELFARYIKPQDFIERQHEKGALVLQIYVPSDDEVWFSMGAIEEGVSKYEGGFKRMKSVFGAPSRSASKLEEALSILDRHPRSGDTAVDLGAAPGGWSLVLAKHGANVKAVDHGKLTIDFSHPKLKLSGSIEHIQDNGLKYMAAEPVDWLVCDMVMGARDTIHVLQQWLTAARMRNFIFNVKLPKDNPWPHVRQVIDFISNLTCSRVLAKQLLHDRSEITIMGVI